MKCCCCWRTGRASRALEGFLSVDVAISKGTAGCRGLYKRDYCGTGISGSGVARTLFKNMRAGRVLVGTFKGFIAIMDESSEGS